MTQIEIRRDQWGESAYATQDIDAGTYLGDFEGQIFYGVNPEDIPEDEFDHWMQIGPTDWIGPARSAIDYTDHSCNPNCRVVKDYSRFKFGLETIRPIRRDEQISWDYSTYWWSNDTSEFECRCGSENCRQIIKFNGSSDEFEPRCTCGGCGGTDCPNCGCTCNYDGMHDAEIS